MTGNILYYSTYGKPLGSWSFKDSRSSIRIGNIMHAVNPFGENCPHPRADVDHVGVCPNHVLYDFVRQSLPSLCACKFNVCTFSLHNIWQTMRYICAHLQFYAP